MSGQIGRAGLQDTVASDGSTTFSIEHTTSIQPGFRGISHKPSTDIVPTESTNGSGDTVVETTSSPSTGILSSFAAGFSTGSSSGTFDTSETPSCGVGECATISSNASTIISSAPVPSFPSTSTSTVSPTAIAYATPSFSPSHHGLSQSSKIAAIVVPILVLLVLVPACIFCFIILRNRRRHHSLRGTVEMKNVSPSSYEAPPHQMSVNRDLPPLPPQKLAQKTASHTIPRRPLARNSTYYTGIGQEVADHNHDHLTETRSVGSAPPGYTNPNSPGLTEQNLLNHTASGDRPPPGERTRSPFEDEDVVSDVSHTGAGRTRRRDVDEESVVSALDEGAVEKKGAGGRHDDDNESVVSALDDEHVERTSGSHGPVKVMNSRTLHLD